MHGAKTRRSEAGEEPFPRDRKLHQIAIAVQVKAECLRPGAAERDDILEIAIVAAADHGHRCAIARGLDDAQLPIDGRDRLEPKARVVVGSDLRKQQREIRAILDRLLEQPIQQLARRAAPARRRRREHRADARDLHRLTTERRLEPVQLRARDDVVSVHQGDPPKVGSTPRRGDLSSIEPSVSMPRQAVVPDGECVVQDTVED